MEYLLGRQYSEVLKAVRTPHFSTPIHLLPKGISYRKHDSIITLQIQLNYYQIIVMI